MLKLVRDVISFAIGLVAVLLLFRFSLRLLSADPASPFVQWVYETSAPLLAPFEAALPTPSAGFGFVIEFSTLLAMVAYSVVGYALQQLLEAIDR